MNFRANCFHSLNVGDNEKSEKAGGSFPLFLI